MAFPLQSYNSHLDESRDDDDLHMIVPVFEQILKRQI
jgi:hypothetical protein